MALVGARDFNGEKELDDIIQDIYSHLQDAGSKRFNRWLGKRSKAYQYHHSWSRVNITLTYFVKDPKRYYRTTMASIEQEIVQFPPNSNYTQLLKKLADFLAQGPSFSEGYECKVKMPAKFSRNWMRLSQMEEDD